MKEYEILGIKLAQFEKDGQIIKYCKLFVCYDDDKTEGRACEALSVKPEFVDGYVPGDKINIIYNKFGKIEGLGILR